MQPLGTILPTAASLRESDIWHAQNAADKVRFAKSHPVLSNCEKRTVGNEVRYYLRADRYAVVSRDKRVRWFDVTASGDFASKRQEPSFNLQVLNKKP